jgi:hypothetical protein
LTKVVFEHPKMRVQKIIGKGIGLIATEHIPKNEILLVTAIFVVVLKF